MKSATLVHMLVQDLNQNFKLNSYEKYLEDYPGYKKLIEILGEHYLESPEEEISFLLDEFELNNLLDTDISLEEIKTACTNLLTGNNQKELSSGKIFGNIINVIM